MKVLFIFAILVSSLSSFAQVQAQVLPPLPQQREAQAAHVHEEQQTLTVQQQRSIMLASYVEHFITDATVPYLIKTATKYEVIKKAESDKYVILSYHNGSWSAEPYTIRKGDTMYTYVDNNEYYYSHLSERFVVTKEKFEAAKKIVQQREKDAEKERRAIAKAQRKAAEQQVKDNMSPQERQQDMINKVNFGVAILQTGVNLGTQVGIIRPNQNQQQVFGQGGNVLPQPVMTTSGLGGN